MIVAALPRVFVLTDRTQTGGAPLADVVARALADTAGTVGVVFREKDLPREERALLAADVRAVAEASGALFVMGIARTGIDEGGILGGDSAVVHLPADLPRSSVADGAIVGRSCHSLAEVRIAESEGCAYVTLSPIFPSPSKPGYGPALGVGSLSAAASGRAVPIYALGGVSGSNAVSCIQAGAHGIAIMGAAMRAPASVPQLVRAIDSALVGPSNRVVA